MLVVVSRMLSKIEKGLCLCVIVSFITYRPPRESQSKLGSRMGRFGLASYLENRASMFGLSAATETTIIAAVATLGIGSVIASILSAAGARAVALSQLRQTWINSLRDDLVEYLKRLDVLHNALRSTGQQDNIRAASISLTEPYRRILLRLNLKEKLHKDLASEMAKLHFIEGAVVDPAAVDRVLHCAQLVLKYEWQVTKGIGKIRLWMAGLFRAERPNLVAAIHKEVDDEHRAMMAARPARHVEPQEPTEEQRHAIEAAIRRSR
jgi:hypothetical protein